MKNKYINRIFMIVVFENIETIFTIIVFKNIIK